MPIDLARADLAPFVQECDVVFHEAAEPGVGSSWGTRFDAYLRNNVLATQHLLEALKDRPEVRLVYASSSSVYGNADRRPTPEEAPTRPLSPYGQTKLSAEHVCHIYWANYGVDYVALRYFTVFGPRQRPDMAFSRFLKAAREGKPITIFGDGRQTRDFTFVGDVVAATQRAATVKLDSQRAYNVGGGSPTSLRDVLGSIEDIVGRRLARIVHEPAA